MSKIIFSPFKLEIINSYAQKSEEKKYNGSPKILAYEKTLDDFKKFSIST